MYYGGYMKHTLNFNGFSFTIDSDTKETNVLKVLNRLTPDTIKDIAKEILKTYKKIKGSLVNNPVLEELREEILLQCCGMNVNVVLLCYNADTAFTIKFYKYLSMLVYKKEITEQEIIDVKEKLKVHDGFMYLSVDEIYILICTDTKKKQLASVYMTPANSKRYDPELVHRVRLAMLRYKARRF